MNDVNTTNLRTLAGEGILQMSDEGRKIFFQCMDEIDELRNETRFLCQQNAKWQCAMEKAVDLCLLIQRDRVADMVKARESRTASGHCK